MRNSTKHEPTDSYFYLSRQLAECMMRADDLNLHIYPVRTEITGMKYNMISHLCDLDKNKSKEILADEDSLQVCSTDGG